MPTCRSWKTGLEFWIRRPNKLRSLVSNSIYAKMDRNALPVHQVAVCTLQVYPPPPVPPFLLAQNPSPKDIAGSDIMKLYIRYRPLRVNHALFPLNCKRKSITWLKWRMFWFIAECISVRLWIEDLFSPSTYVCMYLVGHAQEYHTECCYIP